MFEMGISYAVKDTCKSKVDPERNASEFDSAYYRELLDKSWGEAAYVFNGYKKAVR